MEKNIENSPVNLGWVEAALEDEFAEVRAAAMKFALYLPGHFSSTTS